MTWTKDKFTLAYNLDWHDRTRRFSRMVTDGTPDYVAAKYLYYKYRWEHDVQASYDVDDRFGFYLGVNNLINQQPSIGATSYPVSGIGRFCYAGVRVGLGKQ